MITGDIKNKIDQIWDTFFVAGITNPITVLEQMTYIFFMKLLDDKQLHEEENARDWGIEINLDIPLPPLPLQQLFASRITRIETQKAEVQRTINDLETLLASRMQYWFE